MAIDYIGLCAIPIIGTGVYFTADFFYAFYYGFWRGVSKEMRTFGPFSKTIKDCTRGLEDIASA